MDGYEYPPTISPNERNRRLLSNIPYQGEFSFNRHWYQFENAYPGSDRVAEWNKALLLEGIDLERYGIEIFGTKEEEKGPAERLTNHLGSEMNISNPHAFLGMWPSSEPTTSQSEVQLLPLHKLENISAIGRIVFGFDHHFIGEVGGETELSFQNKNVSYKEPDISRMGPLAYYALRFLLDGVKMRDFGENSRASNSYSLRNLLTKDFEPRIWVSFLAGIGKIRSFKEGSPELPLETIDQDVISTADMLTLARLAVSLVELRHQFEEQPYLEMGCVMSTARLENSQGIPQAYRLNTLFKRLGWPGVYWPGVVRFGPDTVREKETALIVAPVKREEIKTLLKNVSLLMGEGFLQLQARYPSYFPKEG